MLFHRAGEGDKKISEHLGSVFTVKKKNIHQNKYKCGKNQNLKKKNPKQIVGELIESLEKSKVDNQKCNFDFFVLQDFNNNALQFCIQIGQKMC